MDELMNSKYPEQWTGGEGIHGCHAPTKLRELQ